MNKNKLNILDCTLRDGGYYNNWDFSASLVSAYLQTMKEIKVEYIEIGFRSLDANEYRGPYFYSTDNFLDSLKIPKDLKIAVMVNAAEILSNKFNNPMEVIKLLFKNKKKSKVSLVRIACHLKEVKKIIKPIKWLKSQGYTVGLNLMQIADKSNKEIEQISSLVSSSEADVFYFADSMGSLDEAKTLDIIKLIRKKFKGQLGIHAHDNMGRALSNTIAASEASVTWLDSTVLGMGRGPGNTKTESLILEMEKKFKLEINYFALLSLIEKYFKKLLEKYKWGSNPFYYIAGMNNIHPSFIQGMLTDNRYGTLEILGVLDNLKSEGGKKFNKEILEMKSQSYAHKTKGSWDPKDIIKNREVLILGSGPSIKIHSMAIEKFIIKKKPFVIGLNIQEHINNKLINMIAACHTLRLLTDINKYKKIKYPLILPFESLSDNIKQTLKGIKIKDYGLQVIPNTFKFEDKRSVIPNSLAISYALAISNSGNAKKIYLAGFDGYHSDDARRIEMDNMFSLYSSIDGAAELISITQTKYKVKSSSVYANFT